jgi:PiT family inorganic phosphate transporter
MLRAVNTGLTLALVVITALAFDFTNGFHDTGNAMATSIATGALSPRIAVFLSAALNMVGAFLSFSVAATIASGLVNSGAINLTVVFAGLCGGITWNLLTWYFGIPSSSSHALIGGVIGASLAAAGSHAVKWQGLVSKVIIPGVLSPFIALGIAAVGTCLVYRLSRDVPTQTRSHGFRIGQIGSASMVSLAHGTNDAQKTMGVITLALVASGSLASGSKAPSWVIISCALAISLGTWIGGWRVIRTMGKGLTDIESPQGMAAEAASASAILLSSHFGYSLSTTQVATGSILGSGVGRKTEVRWSVAGRMVSAWIVTMPAAGAVGALAYAIANGIGGNAGIILVFLAVVVIASTFYRLSRKTKVTPQNVNDDWPSTVRTSHGHGSVSAMSPASNAGMKGEAL